MQTQKNILVKGVGGRAMVTDIFVTESNNKKPVVIYVHGFNGFKDWGNFDLIAKQFAEDGFVFVKFNFSHNGTTVDAPEDFADLGAYAENNYTKELDDLKVVIDWVSDRENPFAKVVDTAKILLLGHSMGGGISILKAHEDDRIKALATWASIGECKTPWGTWSQEKLQKWKTDGVAYVANSRTKQDMPLHYQLYENYINNQQRLDIKVAVRNLNMPVLLCHGKNDEAVPVEVGYELHSINPATELFIVDSDHVFGRKHPWNEKTLPAAMQQVLDKTIEFFTACM